nr:immunoglobulin heavy chain junction region [Macaca mulatta]MOY28003.1 immunoglobulin heavy chain junction region [Macaca mulatta]MOY28919.1 immunoglobulin heavy chain junction region [Macaca mulatta]MOY29295.1 immunoglobulin heavy chain junction region [Macaca mulatta]MOY30711.1 immunoglobulin heavy chain junction region [Macaca mulatta]
CGKVANGSILYW